MIYRRGVGRFWEDPMVFEGYGGEISRRLQSIKGGGNYRKLTANFS